MAQITLETTIEEQNVVLKALVELNGAVAPVATIASMTGLRPSRTRYVLMDLIDQGKVERVPHKAFNKHYVRYSYLVLKN